MAKTQDQKAPAKSGAAKSAPAGKAPVPAKAKAKAAEDNVNLDDLSALAAETQEQEEVIRAQSGSNLNWMKTIIGGSPFLQKRGSEYIEGASEGDIMLPGVHEAFESVTGTILAMVKVYSEKKPAPTKEDGKKDGMDATVSFWMPEDAEQVPTKEGSNFIRELSNGNYLQPMHWILFRSDEHPEIKDLIIPFQSKGNSYYADINKMVKKSSTIATELKVRIFTDGVWDKDYNKYNYYYKAEIVGKNFEFDPETKKISVIKGGMKPAEIAEVLSLSKNAQADYNAAKMVTKRAPAQISASIGTTVAPRKGLPAAGGGGYEADDSADGEHAQF